MKFFLALVGTLCLGVAAQAQSTVSLNVAGNVTIGLTAINNTINVLNNTCLAADKGMLVAWKYWGNTMIANLTSLMNRFKNYSTVDLTPINSSISNIQNMLNTSQINLLSTDYNVQNLLSTFYQVAAQTGDLLIDTAANLTSQANCTNDVSLTCLRKYGANLTAAPILMSRFNDCLAVENVRLAQIGVNASTQINNTVTTAQTFFNLISICNVPTAAALNASYPQLVPSIQCLNTYLSQIGYSNPVSYINYGYEMMRSQQTQVVYFRANRCAQLVQYDIQDAVTRVKAAFGKCLTTGS
ncbi:uncharacterized protein LOC131690263 [Topomyia yanbarensis]|uniref:uncharacterized protein LOC131690263 n=1 Tax=Topomyia yanbarensis TaxID=2498891 RepID=UPI00273A94EF|nr:uncharacterized protein LOC131690263 [Topomyia yanbarensis]